MMDFLLGASEFNQILVMCLGNVCILAKTQTLIHMREMKIVALPILLGYWVGV